MATARSSAIRQVDADGQVVCEMDDDTTYTAGTGLMLSSGQFGLTASYSLPPAHSPELFRASFVSIFVGNGNSMATNGKNGKKRRRWIWAIVAVLVLTGAGVGVRAALKPNAAIDPSKLSSVENGDIARSVVATGKIQPRSKVEVKSKASGIVERLLVDYGDWVKQEQVLAELDKEELRARVREANAYLLAAQAAEQSSQAAHQRNQVEAEGPDVAFARRNVDRAEQLVTDRQREPWQRAGVEPRYLLRTLTRFMA